MPANTIQPNDERFPGSKLQALNRPKEIDRPKTPQEPDARKVFGARTERELLGLDRKKMRKR